MYIGRKEFERQECGRGGSKRDSRVTKRATNRDDLM